MYRSAGWLEEAAFFAAIDEELNTLNWHEWPDPLKDRHLSALEHIYQAHEDFVSAAYSLISHSCELCIVYWICDILGYFEFFFFCMQINTFLAQQFLFQRQWQKVRSYANNRGIKVIGDMPIYVGYHSADVWANKRMFLLVS